MNQSVYVERIRRARRAVAEKGSGGVVIGTGPELAFFTGSWAQSHERLTALVIGPDGAPRLVAPLTDVDSFRVDGVEIVGWRDGDDPYELVVHALGDGPVGLGTSLTADHVLRLQRLVPTSVLAADLLADVLMAKEPDEIAQLRRAAEAIDRVHQRVPELLRVGRTENEVAHDIAELIRADHESVDFIIVGSGPNGANPHHSHSQRVLAKGDPVVVDLGGSLDTGYHSDCTRTYVVGAEPDPEVTAAYEVLARAQQAAFEAVRPGISAGEVDAAAREVIGEAGYGEFFTHRTGHGIGLALHERPFIAPGESTELREGMAFSIEPGIYIPGRWGMRLEDIVVVDAEGAVRLNRVSRTLR
ncbi:M24 family metallopeptidase [Corynebacterium sp. LK2510]|uniref:M24 family metallopeptidase n=1 Tax=Corynebacterium sp. LK2510 TaxID=3110472 RepID=UPI0034CF0CAC